MSTSVQLRPIDETELDQLRRFFIEDGLAGEFDWFVYRLQHAADEPATVGLGAP